MRIAGEDHGQTRFGLMPSTGKSSTAVASLIPPAAAEPQQKLPVVSPVVATPSAGAEQPILINAAFAPEAPVMVAPTAVAPQAAAAPEVTGRIALVNTKRLNVRSGPGTDYAVVESLARGDSVLIVSEEEGPDAWAMIRIEGDGVEGFVASRLLTAEE
ncbi:MAG: SH3 domain-containing protein [Cypionkella sp.]